ncbi:MAG TPA: nucleoside kinase [Tenuifilaceae bacterium]|jgi:uridine kinase|nr:nucleoside kinase [Bacteroidales bacterium]MDI9516608.1 nucleoside kinase [Bacteroidota bacterium]NLH55790.1 nucleoside kinase [Rikenellaceae bacterium]OQC61774.1 MAG: Threonine--tRNA ligase [Bacteroidetes bacterium ADurb.Bin008]HNS31082.1 nucleoside kinase [Tenuifilaceae bacterium]
MKRDVQIICENTGKRELIKPGLSLLEVSQAIGVKLAHPILGAMVNNELRELDYCIYSPKTIRFIDITHPAGMRMYQRSLFFLLSKAVRDVVPGGKLRIEHSVSKGFYCEIEGLNESLEYPLIFSISDRMHEIVDQNLPFSRDKVLTTDVVKLFRDLGDDEKANLFETRSTLYTSVYYLNDSVDYFFGSLVPSTGYLKVFDLVKYYQGMLLMVPKRSNPNEMEDIVLQNKMFDIFREYREWVDIIGVSSVATINKQVQQGGAGELIKISEALHERKVIQIADQIYSRRDKVRIVLISGPSSSGKTTFAKRIAVQLKVSGLKPYTISLDNYFVDREKTPRDEHGEYDFETIHALDIEYFNQDLIRLLRGEEVELPKFSFETGKRFFDGTKLAIESNGIIIIEGIHALNPELTHLIESERKFRIYISALTSLSIDGTNRIPTTDNRLIRRIIRDYRYRSYSALDTISRWESVRRGEDRYIFPYQEEADVMFNTSLLYEFGILKPFAEPILAQVPMNVPEYAEARRLLKFLSYFVGIPYDEIPPTSILREFLGGSTFSYK